MGTGAGLEPKPCTPSGSGQRAPRHGNGREMLLQGMLKPGHALMPILVQLQSITLLTVVARAIMCAESSEEAAADSVPEPMPQFSRSKHHASVAAGSPYTAQLPSSRGSNRSSKVAAAYASAGVGGFGHSRPGTSSQPNRYTLLFQSSCVNTRTCWGGGGEWSRSMISQRTWCL